MDPLVACMSEKRCKNVGKDGRLALEICDVSCTGLGSECYQPSIFVFHISVFYLSAILASIIIFSTAFARLLFKTVAACAIDMLLISLFMVYFKNVYRSPSS